MPEPISLVVIGAAASIIGVFEGLAGACRTFFPAETRTALAAVRDRIPFSKIGTNGNLRRVVHEAWVEAGLSLCRRASDEGAVAGEAKLQADFVDAFQAALRNIRSASYNPDVVPGGNAIDDYVTTILDAGPRWIGEQTITPEAERMVDEVGECFARIANLPASQVPQKVVELARNGYVTHDGAPRRPFVVVLFDSFTAIIKEGRNREATEAYRHYVLHGISEDVKIIKDAVASVDTKTDALLDNHRRILEQLEKLRRDNFEAFWKQRQHEVMADLVARTGGPLERSPDVVKEDVYRFYVDAAARDHSIAPAPGATDAGEIAVAKVGAVVPEFVPAYAKVIKPNTADDPILRAVGELTAAGAFAEASVVLGDAIETARKTGASPGQLIPLLDAAVDMAAAAGQVDLSAERAVARLLVGVADEPELRLGALLRAFPAYEERALQTRTQVARRTLQGIAQQMERIEGLGPHRAFDVDFAMGRALVLLEPDPLDDRDRDEEVARAARAMRAAGLRAALKLLAEGPALPAPVRAFADGPLIDYVRSLEEWSERVAHPSEERYGLWEKRCVAFASEIFIFIRTHETTLDLPLRRVFDYAATRMIEAGTHVRKLPEEVLLALNNPVTGVTTYTAAFSPLMRPGPALYRNSALRRRDIWCHGPAAAAIARFDAALRAAGDRGDAAVGPVHRALGNVLFDCALWQANTDLLSRAMAHFREAARKLGHQVEELSSATDLMTALNTEPAPRAAYPGRQAALRTKPWWRSLLG